MCRSNIVSGKETNSKHWKSNDSRLILWPNIHVCRIGLLFCLILQLSSFNTILQRLFHAAYNILCKSYKKFDISDTQEILLEGKSSLMYSDLNCIETLICTGYKCLNRCMLIEILYQYCNLMTQWLLLHNEMYLLVAFLFDIQVIVKYLVMNMPAS